MRKRGPRGPASQNTRGKLSSSGGMKGRKKLLLDVILDNEPRQLLKGYGSDQLQELFYKVNEVSNELDRILESEGEIKEILGTKMENKTLWFYVRWDNNEQSFIPAKALNRIAPSKVIQYYESILQFQPDPESLHNTQERKAKSPPQPPRSEIQPPHPKPPTNIQLRPAFHTVHCTGCSILLQYPEGTKAIKCPVCNCIMVVPHKV